MPIIIDPQGREHKVAPHAVRDFLQRMGFGVVMGLESDEGGDDRLLPKKKLGRFFVGGGSGEAIVDFTPTRQGTRRRLGSF